MRVRVRACVCKLCKLPFWLICNFCFSVTVFLVLKYTVLVIVYCGVNVQPRFNFSDEIIIIITLK